jgi:glycosyltransferase involved in cell wall biosynthesis
VLGKAGIGARKAVDRGLRVWVPPGGTESLRRELARRPPRIVFAHYSFQCAALHAALGIPFVQVLHNVYAWFAEEDKARFVESAQHTALFIAVSEEVKEYSARVLGVSPEKCRVIANGVDTSRFTSAAREEALRLRESLGGEFVFLGVGSVTRHKRQMAVIRAFRCIRDLLPQARLLLVGYPYDADYLDAMLAYINRNDLSDSVRYAGHSANPEHGYLAADAFVHASCYEGGQLVLLEALAANCAVVSTDVGFMRHFTTLPGIRTVEREFVYARESFTRSDAFSSPPRLVAALALGMLAACREQTRPNLPLALIEAFDARRTYAAYERLAAEMLGEKPRSPLAKGWMELLPAAPVEKGAAQTRIEEEFLACLPRLAEEFSPPALARGDECAASRSTLEAIYASRSWKLVSALRTITHTFHPLRSASAALRFPERLLLLAGRLRRCRDLLRFRQGIIFCGRYPYPEEQSDGYAQRVAAIDRLFPDHLRVYIDKRYRRHGEGRAWEHPEPSLLIFHFCGSPLHKLAVTLCIVLVALRFRKIYFHSAFSLYPGLRTLMRLPGMRSYFDVHGIVSEECRYNDDQHNAARFEKREKYAAMHARYVIVVTRAMGTYLRGVYREALRGRVLTLPIVPVVPARPWRQAATGRPVVVYAGGMQKWQCAPRMAQAIARRPDDFFYRIHTPDPELFLRLLPEALRGSDALVVSAKAHEELMDIYPECHFGFLLREDAAVNRVACPTKLVEYLASGVVPIVDSPHIGDFAEYCLRYVTLREFEAGRLPDEETRRAMARENLEIYRKLLKIGEETALPAPEGFSGGAGRITPVSVKKFFSLVRAGDVSGALSRARRHLFGAFAGGLFTLSRAQRKLYAECINAYAAARRGNERQILIFETTVTWHEVLFQRPQQLALALGELGHFVVYKQAHPGILKIRDNLWVIDERLFTNPAAAVRLLCSTYRHPEHILRHASSDDVIVYEYIDHIDAKISGNPDALVANKRRMFAEADIVCASARRLHAEAASSAKGRVLLLPNGVDARHYFAVTPNAAPPPDMAPFCGRYPKIIGYFGALAPWLDYGLINDLIMLRQDLGFIFIGPEYAGRCAARLRPAENLLLTGQVAYGILPEYAQCFTVCWIPFEPGDIAKSTSPLKLFEYFALGKPVVVSADLHECAAFPQVLVGHDVPSFSRALDQALSLAQDPAHGESLKGLAVANSWQERARALSAALQELRAERQARRRAARPVTA